MDRNGTPAPLHSWSTAQAGSNAPLTYWVEAICEAFLDLKVDSPERFSFHGRLDKHPLGAIDLNYIHASAQNVWRTPREIARRDGSEFYLILTRNAPMSLRQRGREAVLAPGECVLLDSNEPAAFSFPSTFDVLSIQIPSGWLHQRMAHPEDATAIRFGRNTGWGETLASAASNLQQGALAALAMPASEVAEHLAALLALAGGAPSSPTTSHQAQMLKRLQATIRDRCHENALSPADVAEANGISKRYLHLLFAQANSSFGAALMNERLAHARRMLEDASMKRLAIGEIAARCGFADPSHFARRFRLRFGTSPDALRRALHS